MSNFTRISVSDAHALMQSQNVSIVDIRDEDSYRLGRIKTARHLDNAGIHRFIQEADLDLPVVVCCYHGNSSQPAAAWLAEQGFDQAYSLDGGFTEWQLAYPAEVETDHSV